MTQIWRRYLLWFAQEHVEFRFEEMNSLLTMFKINMRYVELPTILQPYWIVEFQSEEQVKLVASRSVLLKTCIELWGYADTANGLHEKLKTYPFDKVAPYLKSEQSFKIDVETFSKHFSQAEKVEKLETFSYIPFKGNVKLKDPDVSFQYIEYYGVDPKQPPEYPDRVFFGRWISGGLRQLIKYLSLKTRKFIGNTSMDAQLSIIMANQAQVKPGDMVLDPFVGSGSLLVAAAKFGGYVLGTDIDYLMLHARTRPSRIKQKKRAIDESVKSNMEQYDLKNLYLDVLVNDFALSFWRHGLEFDCIITDPPYGIRESTERIGTSKESFTISEKHLRSHIPAKVQYGLSKVYCDLLNFTAKHLKLGGRMVCWFPVFRSDYNDDELPKHLCLKLINNSEQVLNKNTSRRLLTYQKYKPYNEVENSLESSIKDFRVKYYEMREETRKERRLRKAELKEMGRQEAEKRRK